MRSKDEDAIFCAALDAADKAEKEVARLQTLLKEIEWGGWDELLGAVCPSCENWKEKGHTPDCALRAALAPPPEVERGKCGECGGDEWHDLGDGWAGCPCGAQFRWATVERGTGREGTK